MPGVGELRLHAGHHREGEGGEQQRVAVGRALRHEVAADDGAGARLVVDDHRLAELARHALARDAGDDVAAAPRREGHDDTDGTVGVSGAGPGGQRRGAEREGQGGEYAGTVGRRRAEGRGDFWVMENFLGSFLSAPGRRPRPATIPAGAVAASGQDDHAVGRAHALALGQHEDRVDLGLDQPVAELRRHVGEGDDGIDQRGDVGLGAAAEAVEQRPGLQLRAMRASPRRRRAVRAAAGASWCP